MEYRYLGTRGSLNEEGPGGQQAQGQGQGGPLAARVSRRSRGDRAVQDRPGDAGAVTTLSSTASRDPETLAELVPRAIADREDVVPLQLVGETVVLGALEAGDIARSDRISMTIARPVRLQPIDRATLTRRQAELYGPRPRARHQWDRGRGRGPAAAAPVSAVREMPYDQDDDFDLDPYRGETVVFNASDWGWSGRGRDPIDRHRLASPGLVQQQPQIHIPGGFSQMFTFVVEEGQRVLMRRPNGTMDVVVGPRRVWRGRNQFRAMSHHVAHPGDYLIVRYRDGRQEHLAGPAEVWFDPRLHEAIEVSEALQIAAKEAVVVYSQKEGAGTVQRRIEYGPALFMPRPGEWLHTFSWHASKGGAEGVVKIPNGLVFQKLWLMPDQMYHDVADVRTADDAVLRIRLMIFFELIDIDRMLDATHDPIGDFVNAASSDVVDFTGRHDFESFKHNTERLNELEAYRQLTGRAAQCGYRINKVVYRGYGAADRLQQMHDQAIEARTRLQLDRATEQQSQDLENFKLDSQLARAGKRRTEQAAEVAHDLELDARRQEAKLRAEEARRASRREAERLDLDQRRAAQALDDARRREHLASLRDLGVDLTAYLTQGRADRVIELRSPPGNGNGATHIHVDPASASRRADGVS